MTRLIGLALALTNLAEAEGRSIRRNATKVVGRAATLLVLGLIFLLGVGFALAGLFLVLEPQTGAPGAALITGLGTMTLSGAAAWLASDRNR